MEGRGYVPDLLVRVWDPLAQPPRYADTLHDVKTIHAQRDPAATTAYAYSGDMSVDKTNESAEQLTLSTCPTSAHRVHHATRATSAILLVNDKKKGGAKGSGGPLEAHRGSD